MTQRLFDDVAVGDRLSGYLVSPSTAQLMRYSGVIWNTHRIHFDHAHAAAEGYPGILVQSYLHQAFLTKLVTDWTCPKGRLRLLTNTVRRFATTDDQLKLHGPVVEVSPIDENAGLVTVEIEEVRVRDDVVCAPGRADIELPRNIVRHAQRPVVTEKQVSSQQSAGPLTGLRVIELGSIVAASFAARMLADLGAEVIKIEGPDNLDPLREWGQGSVDGRALWWTIQSRNKKLVTLDLHLPQGQELLKALSAESDVLIENFRPGTLEKWNLGYHELSKDNKRLLLARLSGFGQTGPYRRRPGFAAVAEGMSGMRYINGYPGQAPPRVGLSLGDSLAGLFAAQGILAALYERTSSGLGQEIDISLIESCLALMESGVAEYDRLGKIRQPTGTGIPGVSPSNIFRTKDDNWFIIAASQARMFERLCVAMGEPALATDPRFCTHDGRRDNQQDLENIVAGWTAAFTSAELQQILVDNAIAAGPVYSIADVVEDEQLKSRKAFVMHHDDKTGDFLAQGVTPRFSRTPGGVRWSGAWTPGAHNDEVFGSVLKLDQDDIEKLAQQRII